MFLWNCSLQSWYGMSISCEELHGIPLGVAKQVLCIVLLASLVVGVSWFYIGKSSLSSAEQWSYHVLLHYLSLSMFQARLETNEHTFCQLGVSLEWAGFSSFGWLHCQNCAHLDSLSNLSPTPFGTILGALVSVILQWQEFTPSQLITTCYEQNMGD